MLFSERAKHGLVRKTFTNEKGDNESCAHVLRPQGRLKLTQGQLKSRAVTLKV